MRNSDIQVCRDYASAMFRRTREPLPPLNFQPNWEDQPSRFKIYEQVERFALSLAHPARCASISDVLKRITASPGQPEALTLETLSVMLQFSLGLLGRRLRINWNQNARKAARYVDSGVFYSRGTASGGGMYPTEIYLASGPHGRLLPGVYHYDPAHHAFARLFLGDVTHAVRVAVFGHEAALRTDQFLLITLNFWKNAFKYNSFCYHVVLEDLGALLCSLGLLAATFHSTLQPLLWFQDEALNQLLALDLDHESVFAVIPLPSAQSEQNTGSVDLAFSQPAVPALSSPLRQRSSFQRSKEVIVFDMNVEAHRATLIVDEPRPPLDEALRASVGEAERTIADEHVALPPPQFAQMDRDLLKVFQQRQSSFGTFSSDMPLSRVELATILSFATAVSNYGNDVKHFTPSLHFTQLMVFVNNVEGIARGAYSYDPLRHCLWTICYEDFRLILQENYFLENYSLRETGAVIAIAGNLERMLEVYGNRGYRILSAEVGMIAQSVYMAAAALSVACGAALGFDNLALNSALKLDGTGDKTFLFLLVGHERQGIGNIDYRLV